jgi:hypothetical protein
MSEGISWGVSLAIPCLKCRQITEQRVGWLVDHDHIVCACGKPLRSNHHACGHVCAQRTARARAPSGRRCRFGVCWGGCDLTGHLRGVVTEPVVGGSH